MLFDRILVPLDGSETAESILAQISRLLRNGDSEVTLLEAVSLPPQAGMEYAGLIGTLKEEADKYISALTKNLEQEGVRARGVVRVGPEAATILDVAAERHSTLIAMATHGRTGVSRFIMGSVTEKVLRASPVPVLVVRSFKSVGPKAKRAAAHEIPFRHILVPVDGSETSLAVLPAVKEFAKAFKAKTMVLGVVDPEAELRGQKGSGEPLVRLAVKDLGDAGVAVDPVVRLGDPASEILDSAKRHDIDLVAMCTHGRSGPSRWVFGSVTEKVVRSSEVPLLVVRAAR